MTNIILKIIRWKTFIQLRMKLVTNRNVNYHQNKNKNFQYSAFHLVLSLHLTKRYAVSRNTAAIFCFVLLWGNQTEWMALYANDILTGILVGLAV